MPTVEEVMGRVAVLERALGDLTQQSNRSGRGDVGHPRIHGIGSHVPRHKDDATAAPTVNDDSSERYGVSSEWDDRTNDKSYRCLDATVGAAVWLELANGTSSHNRSHDHSNASDTSEIVPLSVNITTWLRLSGEFLDTSIDTGDNDNFNPAGDSGAGFVINVTGGASTITGIVPEGDGHVLFVWNYGDSALTLAHNRTSDAANRFFLSGGNDIVINQYEGVWLRYEGNNTRWSCIGEHRPSAFGTAANDHSESIVRDADQDTYLTVEESADEDVHHFYAEGVERMTIGKLEGVDVFYVATEDDEHGFEIKVDAAGFADIKAALIEYVTGALASGEEEAVIAISINEFAANGGTVVAVEVLATDGGADNLWALKAGAGVGPVEQHSGTFENPDSATNDTADTQVGDMKDGSEGTNTTIFAVDEDYIIIGHEFPFTEIEFDIETPANNPGIRPTFEYSKAGGTWAFFTPIDLTNGFRDSAVVGWDASDLTDHAVHTSGGDTDTYDIRITRTHAVAGSVSLFFAKIATTVIYSWDPDANVSIKTLDIGGTVVATGTLDEDDLASDSAVSLATQQSIKAYVDSRKRVISILIGAPDGDAITTGDGKAVVRIAAVLDGSNLVGVAMSLTTISSSGLPTVQLRRNRWASSTTRTDADMLSTKLTIDASEYDSNDAVAAAVINTSNDDVNEDDQIFIDIDLAGTGAKGLFVEMTFQLP